MLQAHDIHFCIKNRPIVDKASVNLMPGELTVILGPNGAGKSTLFKVLSGESQCKHGNIVYNGQALHTFNPKQLAQVRAVMPQHSSLTFPFKVEEVIELGLLSLGKTYRISLLEEVMKITQTWEFREQLYGNLSGGEKQRVQLARVLIQIWEKRPFPRYLLLDEPTSSMDIALQHLVLQIINKIKSRNIAVLAILHDFNLAANYADKIVLMAKGLIYTQGNVQETLTTTNLREVFNYPIQVIPPSSEHPMIIQSMPNYQYNSAIQIA